MHGFGFLLLASFALLTKQKDISPLTTTDKPNIIFIFVDDVGWNDFGFNQNTDTQTPFIDNLVETESLLLWNNYVQQTCSPTRAAFLTGRYPSHLGLQHGVFIPNLPYSLTRQTSLLSNEFQFNGYSTHLIGKYHLGFQSIEYTPLFRGFDTFKGFYSGDEDHYTHIASLKEAIPPMNYYDLRDGLDELTITDSDQSYSVYWQRDAMISLLQDLGTDSDTTQTQTQNDPFFIYLAFQAAHFPPQAPIEYSQLYCDPSADVSSDSDSNGDAFLPGDCTLHNIHQAQMTSIDDAMEAIITFMKTSSNDLWDNTLVVFSSDNGAAMFSGDNAPFRGCKTTVFEGGIRVPAFVTGGVLNDERKGDVLDEIAVHTIDWYPTLLSAAGLDVNYRRSQMLSGDSDGLDDRFTHLDDGDVVIDIDGRDLWDAIQNNVIGDSLVEREILLHLDETDCEYDSCGALLFGQWKMVRGPYVCGDPTKCGWNNAFMSDIGNGNLLGCAVEDTPVSDSDSDSTEGVPGDGRNEKKDDPCVDGCLFDLEADPCEYHDLKADYADIYAMMEAKLTYWQLRAVKPLMGPEMTVLDYDEVNPELVCDGSQFWCSYQDYGNVEFENQLASEYIRLYSVDHTNDDDSVNGGAVPMNVFMEVIALSMLISLMAIVFVKYKNPMDKDTVRETMPLLQ